MIYRYIFRFFSFLPIVIATNSCTTTPKFNEFPEDANAAVEISTFKRNLDEAVAIQADVLSPISFKEATLRYNAAEKEIKKSTSSKEALHEIALGQAYLDMAIRNTKFSYDSLTGVVNARAAAITAGAKTRNAKDLLKEDEKLKAVMVEVERGKTENAVSQREAFQLAYMGVELDSIKIQYLSGAESLLKTAKDEGAAKFAPKTLTEVERTLEQNYAFITANRVDRENIRARSEATTNDARRLVDVTRKSKSNMNRTSEESTIAIESEENKVNSAKDELRIKEEQSAQVANQNVLLQKEMTNKNDQLQKDKDFNQAFENARSHFTDREAVVYRQGNRLVVRLNSFGFPSNKSNIQQRDLALLSKVSTMVKGFPNSTVIVEGHTDSIGNKDSNQKLSTDRAETISQYLVSNQSVSSGDITPEGHGSEHPLASNKTETGRAQNRRIDIIISPEQPTE
ncbi:MAG: OmpA family protein [Proteobacteria bacterium]|nr:OmpA family protein [Pseudomonadota bacterium]